MYSKHVSEGRTNIEVSAGPQANRKDKEAAGTESKTPEIVVLSTAADVVKGWLEANGDTDEEEDAPPEPELRPPRLGLGAKYLPHAKLSGQMDTLERRLRAKIGGCATQVSGKEDSVHEPPRKKQRAEGGARDGTDGAKNLAEEAESDVSEEEREDRGGRTSAFAKKHRGQPVLEVVQMAKKKKRKKKKKEK